MTPLITTGVDSNELPFSPYFAWNVHAPRRCWTLQLWIWLSDEYRRFAVPPPPYEGQSLPAAFAMVPGLAGGVHPVGGLGWHVAANRKNAKPAGSHPWLCLLGCIKDSSFRCTVTGNNIDEMPAGRWSSRSGLHLGPRMELRMGFDLEADVRRRVDEVPAFSGYADGKGGLRPRSGALPL